MQLVFVNMVVANMDTIQFAKSCANTCGIADLTQACIPPTLATNDLLNKLEDHGWL